MEVGAGVIGNYTYCSTSFKGIGTFKPNEQANSFIGKEKLLEYVEEIRLEVLCDISLVTQVLETIRKVHPYEEPGIDIIPLLDETFLAMKKLPKKMVVFMLLSVIEFNDK